MKAFYLQKADQIFPIFGVDSMDQAKRFTLDEDHKYIVETSEDVYMNIHTGSVGFESDWDNLDEVVKVEYRIEAFTEGWVKAQ